jgi:hypothetical protein
MAKAKAKARHPGLRRGVEVEAVEVCKVEVAATGLEVQGDQGDQHEHGTGHGIDEELHGRVDLLFPPPDADDEVHGDEHDFPEDVEKKQVERDEGTEHPHLKQQQADHVFLHPLLHRRPGGEDGDRHDEGGEYHQPEADPVDPHVIVHAERSSSDPGHVHDELVVGVRHKARNQGKGDEKGHQCHGNGHATQDGVAVLRDEEQ